MKKQKNKILKYFTLTSATLAIAVPTIATLSSCSNSTNTLQ